MKSYFLYELYSLFHIYPNLKYDIFVRFCLNYYLMHSIKFKGYSVLLIECDHVGPQ